MSRESQAELMARIERLHSELAQQTQAIEQRRQQQAPAGRGSYAPRPRGRGYGFRGRAAYYAPPRPVSAVGAAAEPHITVIDGVKYASDDSGRKLVRLAEAEQGDSAAAGASTPTKASVQGTTYVRTKHGNLISLELAVERKKAAEALRKQRLDSLVGIGAAQGAVRGSTRGKISRGRFRGWVYRKARTAADASAHTPHTLTPHRKSSRTGSTRKSKELCRFFQKKGTCTHALTCRYVHDSTKVSICPAFLRGRCPHKATECALSHQPNANRSPHCSYFPNCDKGHLCPYSHIHVGKDAPVCRDFAIYGWCDKGKDCDKRHVFECPEFSETGECHDKNCELQHVLRRRNDASVQDVDDPNRIIEVSSLKRSAPENESNPTHKSRRYMKDDADSIENNENIIYFGNSEEEEGSSARDDDEEDEEGESDEESGDEESESGESVESVDSVDSVDSVELSRVLDSDKP